MPQNSVRELIKQLIDKVSYSRDQLAKGLISQTLLHDPAKSHYLGGAVLVVAHSSVRRTVRSTHIESVYGVMQPSLCGCRVQSHRAPRSLQASHVYAFLRSACLKESAIDPCDIARLALWRYVRWKRVQS